MYFYAHKHRHVIYIHTCHCYCRLVHLMVREKSFESESVRRERKKRWRQRVECSKPWRHHARAARLKDAACWLIAPRAVFSDQNWRPPASAPAYRSFLPGVIFSIPVAFIDITLWHLLLSTCCCQLCGDLVKAWSLSLFPLSLWFVLSFSLLLSRSCYIDFDSGRFLRKAAHSTSSSHFI